MDVSRPPSARRATERERETRPPAFRLRSCASHPYHPPILSFPNLAPRRSLQFAVQFMASLVKAHQFSSRGFDLCLSTLCGPVVSSTGAHGFVHISYREPFGEKHNKNYYRQQSNMRRPPLPDTRLGAEVRALCAPPRGGLRPAAHCM